jgi:two-component system, NarL family, nitrate/nitrite response regulator NarL
LRGPEACVILGGADQSQRFFTRNTVSPPPSPIRVVVVAEVRLYREGLAAALPKDRLTLAGTASDRPDARVLVHSVRPDVVIVDVRMPEAFELMRELRLDIPGTQLIAFAVDDEVSSVITCAEAGAAGYVSVNGEIDDLVSAVERAARGELLCSPRIASELFRHVGERSLRRGSNEAQGPLLTNREHQVLALLRQRLSNKQIAASLNISEATVKNHVHHLLEKLQVSSRNQAASCLSLPASAIPPARTGLVLS